MFRLASLSLSLVLLACSGAPSDGEDTGPNFPSVDTDETDTPGDSADYDLCDGSSGDCAQIRVHNYSDDRLVEMYFFYSDCEEYENILHEDVVDEGNEVTVEMWEGSYCGLLAYRGDGDCAYSGEFTVFSGEEGYYWKVYDADFGSCD